MAKQLKKAPKAKEMDMLPVMSLMTVLIPVLLTMTAFQKIGYCGNQFAGEKRNSV